MPDVMTDIHSSVLKVDLKRALITLQIPLTEN